MKIEPNGDLKKTWGTKAMVNGWPDPIILISIKALSLAIL